MKVDAMFYLTLGGQKQGSVQVDGVEHPEEGVSIGKVTPVTLKTPSGGLLVQGDTHTMWPSHQVDALAWESLLQKLEEEGGTILVEVEVSSSTSLPKKKGKKKRKATKVEL